MTRRRGSALLDLVVALPLLVLVAALAVQGFVAQLRVVTGQEARLRNLRELDHAALALAADLRPLAATDIEAWSDTAVVVWVPVLRGHACGTSGSTGIDVAIGHPGSAARAVVLADPRVGDMVSWAGVDSTVIGLASAHLDAPRHRGAIGAASVAASACTGSPLRGANAPWRLTLVAPLATLPALGTPITIGRRVEWSAYRAGDALFYLGRRDWSGTGWTTRQPVAGPLLPPAHGGLVMRLLQADGSSALDAPSEARQVELELRAPRARVGRSATPPFDSLAVRLALRGGGG